VWKVRVGIMLDNVVCGFSFVWDIVMGNGYQRHGQGIAAIESVGYTSNSLF